MKLFILEPDLHVHNVEIYSNGPCADPEGVTGGPDPPIRKLQKYRIP